MKIELKERGEEHVRIYFEKTRDAQIRQMLPQKSQTAEEAVEDYRKSLKPDASSYGRTIYADGRYVGDIWCYGIHEEKEPDAMISYCIFEKALWGRGAATEALRLFLELIAEKFRVRTVGSFTFAENQASIRVMEKNGFRRKECFVENGIESCYLQWEDNRCPAGKSGVQSEEEADFEREQI